MLNRLLFFMECTNKILISRPAPLGPIRVNCGQCIACRLNRASDWAARIMHEARMSAESYFLTLTYDEENLPRVGNYSTLVKDDVQRFLKRLRKALEPVKLRYYLCGEYGETYGRAHYHVVVFLDSHSEDFERYVNLSWKFGFVHFGNVSFESAAYVARYCTKLLTGPKKEWYIERNILPEFSLMSRRPGIGAKWLEKYGNEVKAHHSIIVKGRKVSPPRYYRDKVYEEVDRSIVRDSVIDKVIARYKESLKFDEVHPTGTYEDAVAESQDYKNRSFLSLKKRGKL